MSISPDNADDDNVPSHAPHESGQLKVSIRYIGPTEAQELIDGSPFNRKVTKATVKKYAADMSAGRWWNNGQPIITTKGNGDGEDAKLLNGAHRCDAIIKSGVTLPFVVVEGVDPRANRTMDIGKPRTLDQMLDLEGHHAPKQLAGAISWLIGYVKGSRLGLSRTFTVLDKFDLFAEHPELESVAMQYTLSVPGKAILSQGMYACLHYLFRQKSEEDAAVFMRQVVSGENLQKGDPALTYREGVTHLAAEDDPQKTAEVQRKCANALVVAWNLFRSQQSWSKFKLTNVTPEIK